MSSLIKAFSTELRMQVTIKEAYDHFTEGSITNKSYFKCPDCNGRATGVNINKVLSDENQPMHFRSYGHDEDCKHENELSEKGKLLSKSTSNVTSTSITPDIFLINLPVRKQFTDTTKSHKSTKRPVAGPGGGKTVDSGSEYYTLTPIVNKFLEYSLSGEEKSRPIQIEKIEMSYDRLFKKIYTWDIDRLQDKKSVFWGDAFINYNSHRESYIIKFTCNIISSTVGRDLRNIPYLEVHDSDIDSHSGGTRLRQKLNNFKPAGTKPGAIVFLYAEPIVVENATPEYTFNFDSLHHIDIRGLSLLDELPA